MVQAYTQQEVQFARKFPDAVANEYFLKPLAPLFANGVEHVDWDIVIKQTRDIFQQFFIATDFTKSSATDGIHLFVVVKDKDGQAALGMIQFLSHLNILMALSRLPFMVLCRRNNSVN